MINDILENALSGIDNNTIDRVLSERYKRTERAAVRTRSVSAGNKSVFFTKIAPAAAALTILLIGFAIIVSHFSDNPGISEGAITTGQPNIPHVSESFISPSLKELYNTKPFSNLLPKKIPEGFTLTSSFLSTYNEITNPENRKRLVLEFQSGDSILEIKIYEYDGQLLADPSDPETYKWDLFYGPSENEGALGANLPNVFGVIKSSDVSKEIVSEKIYTYKNGLCVAGIEILCDDYILDYFYQGEEITGDFFYDLVMSSRFMKREKR